MPDIEMLQQLAKTLEVSINELLSGEELTDEEFRKRADENVIAVSKESAFSFEEKRFYWIKKWRKDHAGLLFVLIVIYIAFLTVPFLLNTPWLVVLAPLVGIIEYGWQNNQMMIYVENNLYGSLK